MKKLLALAALIVAAASFNVGCTASAAIHKADATKLTTTTQAAYVSAPVRK